MRPLIALTLLFVAAKSASADRHQKVSLEKKSGLFSKGNGGMMARLRDIMEIPVQTEIT